MSSTRRPSIEHEKNFRGSKRRGQAISALYGYPLKKRPKMEKFHEKAVLQPRDSPSETLRFEIPPIDHPDPQDMFE